MNYKIFVKTLSLVCITFFISSCGAEGPMGPEGIPGRNGQDGLDGKDGLDAQVYASPWYTPNVWQGASKDWYFDVVSTSISKDIVEAGVIIAYASLKNDLYEAAVRPMPCYINGSNWDYLIPDYGKIEFTCDNVNVPLAGNSFRFVVIPSNYTIQGTLKSKGQKALTVTDLKSMPYSDVCKVLNIAE